MKNCRKEKLIEEGGEITMANKKLNRNNQNNNVNDNDNNLDINIENANTDFADENDAQDVTACNNNDNC